jgi:hypothetical protein
MKSPKR